MKKKIFRWLKVLILVYCIIGIAFYNFQNRLLFHPQAVAKDQVYAFGQPTKELLLPYNASTSLSVVQFLPTGPVQRTGDSAVVLYFHGNSGNITSFAGEAKLFTDQGYEVWMLDYPGYGKSTGTFSESQLYAYALQFYKLARSRYQPSQIILYGQSLGTGIAAELASVRDCRRLILQSPYYSMTSLVRRYLPVFPVSSMLHYHFPTYSWLPAVTAPITIFHGTADRTIPLGNAERLKPLLKPGDRFIVVPDAGHNDLSQDPLFRRSLDSLLRN